jgi:hypothetical protein
MKKQKRVSHTTKHRYVGSHVHYIRDVHNGAYRVWWSNSPGDVFDMIPIDEFERNLLPFVQRFPGLFVVDFPDDDTGALVCSVCIEEKR